MLTVQHYGPPLSVARRIQTQKTKQPKGCSAASVITKREIIMETNVVSGHKAFELRSMLAGAIAGTLSAGPDVMGISAKPGALLVEPLNGVPWVFVEPATMLTFSYVPSSGTDKLRARIAAKCCFDALPKIEVPTRMKFLDGTKVDDSYAAKIAKVVSAACDATELAGEDEMEEFARKSRQTNFATLSDAQT